MIATCCRRCGRKVQVGPHCRRCGDEIFRRRSAAQRSKQPRPEQTEEELDRIIAEQRKCLPEWWNDGDDE